LAFVFSCPYCSFVSKQEPRFLEHLQGSHSLSDLEAYVSNFCAGIYPSCKCGCGENSPWKGWKFGFSDFKRGHNARVSSSFTDPEVIEKMKESRRASREAGDWKVWNSGLSKQTSKVLQEAAEKKSKTLREKYSSGEIVPWQLGLNKENNDSIKRASNTKIRKFSSGELKQWNSGLSKHNCESIRKAAKKISEQYSLRAAGRRLSPEEVDRRISPFGFSVIDDGYTSRKSWGLNVVHLPCGTQQLRSLYSLESGLCVSCHNMTSTGQREIEEFVRSLGVDVICSSRSVIPPQEIDVWIPSKKFGIEFNGLYWHSEKFREKGYHDKKSHSIKEAGGSLLHVFEDEWKNKKKIVQSMILSRIGILPHRVGARSCLLVELEPKNRKEFFESSHIDGDTRSLISWGLIHDGKIVAAISLRKPQHKKWKNYLEVARFATAPGFSVPGGLGRLISQSSKYSKELSYQGLLSYVDQRHGYGNSYQAVGFEKIGITSPRFWWTDYVSRFNRFSIRANKKDGITEKEAASKRGVERLWGNSNAILVMNFK
jgi:hypothetical protein